LQEMRQDATDKHSCCKIRFCSTCCWDSAPMATIGSGAVAHLWMLPEQSPLQSPTSPVWRSLCSYCSLLVLPAVYAGDLN
jgi:hypothetical protein